MAYKKKASDETLLSLYEKLGSCKKVAAACGMCPQSVHERLVKLGVNKKQEKFTRFDELISMYPTDGSPIDLQKIADHFGLPRTSICRIARSLGLTDLRRNVAKEHVEKMKARTPRAGEKHHNWKGGLTSKNLVSYENYCSKLSYAEEVRVCEEDGISLQVRCAYCGKWFSPSVGSVNGRISSLEGRGHGESRFYCSSDCKKLCPTFKKKINIGHAKESINREVQPELRILVFERDKWECQRCGELCGLQCHHFDGINHNPIESADVDACITLCVRCHRLAHSDKGCYPSDMSCGQIELRPAAVQPLGFHPAA